MRKHSVALMLLRHGAMFVVLVCTGGSQTQPTPQAKPASEVADVFALADQPGARVDYTRVHRALNAMKRDDRETALERLIGSRNEELSVDAASLAIAEPSPDRAGAIATRIAEWLPNNQTGILQRLFPVRDQFLKVPRALVHVTLENPKVENATDPEPGSAATAPLGLAALLLAGGKDEGDRQLILDLAQFRPRLWGVWIAVAHAGILDGPRAKLAAAAYRDPGLPLPVRVAAATALGRADPQAQVFAATQVESFLARFANLDLSTMVQGAMIGANSKNDDYHLYFQFTLGLHLAAALLVLDDEEAEPLTARFLKAKNEQVRNLCGIVAARRWPDRLLKTGQGAFSEKEYAALLALTAQYHPEQTAGAAALTPDGLLNAKNDLRVLGLDAIFGQAGNLLKMF